MLRSPCVRSGKPTLISSEGTLLFLLRTPTWLPRSVLQMSQVTENAAGHPIPEAMSLGHSEKKMLVEQT